MNLVELSRCNQDHVVRIAWKGFTWYYRPLGAYVFFDSIVLATGDHVEWPEDFDVSRDGMLCYITMHFTYRAQAIPWLATHVNPVPWHFVRMECVGGHFEVRPHEMEAIVKTVGQLATPETSLLGR
jgi:hypothetical protein